MSADQIVKTTFTVLNDKGLHTRPATELVKCTSKFKAQIFLTYQKLRVNGKSLLGILMLAAARGAKITIEADGDDSAEAARTLVALAKNKFHIDY